MGCITKASNFIDKPVVTATAGDKNNAAMKACAYSFQLQLIAQKINRSFI